MSARTITIDPISRVEGHGKVTIDLDGKGGVSRARFHVTQFRGFEVFTAGRPFEEMPIITQRICGICPVSHQLASAKALRRDLGGGDPPHGQAFAGAAPPGAVHPVPRPPLLLPGQPGSAPGLGRRPPRCATWSGSSAVSPRPRPRASGCASSARRSSRPWAANGFTPPLPYPAGSSTRSPRATGTGSWPGSRRPRARPTWPWRFSRAGWRPTPGRRPGSPGSIRSTPGW